MPPRTRGTTKSKKVAKENINGVSKPKVKLVTKVTNPRKPLADKTNSASDDNSSQLVNKGNLTKENNKNGKSNQKGKVRSLRERVLPYKYKENNVLLKTTQNVSSKPSPSKAANPTKDTPMLSPIKTPQKEAENSQIVDRPKRVCRLPTRFKDHSVSPNKFIPVSCVASTPILKNKTNQTSKIQTLNISCNLSPLSNKCALVEKGNKKIEQLKTRSKGKNSADTNNNPKAKGSSKIQQSLKSPLTSPIKHSSHTQTAGNNILPTYFNLPVVEKEKKSRKRDNSHLDVYEFTYDPNEEPPPKKKKPKKPVKKRPPKPKKIVIKYNYDKNVSKTLAALKDVVNKKPLECKKNLGVMENQISEQQSVPATTKVVVSETPNQIKTTCIQSKNSTNNVAKLATPVQTNSRTLTRVEEIEADFDFLVDHDIDYSPVASPNHGKESYLLNDQDHQAINNPDPLNLQENISFFDEPPVASSSMNVSVRKPHDSPWRVDFDQLPVKWHVKTYVKPNMTPAVECSFVNFDDKNKRKHVYTDMVPESNYEIPEVGDQGNLKQTSIISFFRDRLEKSASKKKRAKSITPTKANSIFEDVYNMAVITNSEKTPQKAPQKIPMKESNLLIDKSCNKGKSCNDTEKVTKNVTEPVKSVAKDKDGTYFGFDDSEDQENISPIKIVNPRVRELRPRGRAVLQEINACPLPGPSRANIPLAFKTKKAVSSEAVNKVYEELKSATDAPIFPEIHTNEDPVDVRVETQNELDAIDDDSQSVHLFEDIEIVHHHKASRKSYGKSKKVTFQNQTTLDGPSTNKYTSDSLSGEEDDLADLTFNFQNMEKKKRKKKGKKKEIQSKKEKAEMDAWAAQFNSMCEDVEEFPLVVE